MESSWYSFLVNSKFAYCSAGKIMKSYNWDLSWHGAGSSSCLRGHQCEWKSNPGLSGQTMDPSQKKKKTVSSLNGKSFCNWSVQRENLLKGCKNLLEQVWQRATLLNYFILFNSSTRREYLFKIYKNGALLTQPMVWALICIWYEYCLYHFLRVWLGASYLIYASIFLSVKGN